MIHFFRKIRKNLLAEGKFRKYVTYGIGEIVLVVIGILIAVQINNWNVSIQNEEKEVLYLTRLTTNLGYDVRLYESIMGKDSVLIDRLKEVEKDLSGFMNTVKRPVEDLGFLTDGYKFTSNKTVIDNLVSSGQIELLRSNYLVEAIFVYYRNTDLIKSAVDTAILNHNNETIRNLILKFDSNSKVDSRYIKNLENSIHFRIDLIERQLKRYESQKNLAKKLIRKINDEIHFIENVY